MADNNVNVSPTPIQRNAEDVAMELTQLYYDKGDYVAPVTIENIQETYSKFYAIARATHEYGRSRNSFEKLEELLPGIFKK